MQHLKQMKRLIIALPQTALARLEEVVALVEYSATHTVKLAITTSLSSTAIWQAVNKAAN